MDEGTSEIRQLLRRTTEGVGRLVQQHVDLAKLEILQGGRLLAADAARLLAFAPFIVVGWLLSLTGAAVYLSAWIGLPAGLLVVGAASLAIGVSGVVRTLKAIRSRPVLTESKDEIGRSIHLLEGKGHEH